MSVEPMRDPRDWHEAFAALPDEAPPADAWARVSGALDAAGPRRVRPHRRRAGLAIAAALAVLAPLFALRLLVPGGSVEPAATSAHSGAGSAAGPREADRAIATPAPPAISRSTYALADPSGEPDIAIEKAAQGRGGYGLDSAAATSTARVPGRVQQSAGTGDPAMPSAGHAGHGKALVSPTARSGDRADMASAELAPPASPLEGNSPKRSGSVAARRDADEALLAAPVPHRGRDATAHTASSAPASVDPLQPLYAEAAQLEALLALTSDDRVASASGAALGDALADRLASIDAALAQAGLPDAQRFALWRERVATLRQYAGIESTERWLAVHGRAYGDAFVRVD